MKATEARELALKQTANKQYPEIIREIEKQSEKGNLECWIYYDINPETRRLLIDDGYSVSLPQFDRNEALIKIEW